MPWCAGPTTPANQIQQPNWTPFLGPTVDKVHVHKLIVPLPLSFMCPWEFATTLQHGKVLGDEPSMVELPVFMEGFMSSLSVLDHSYCFGDLRDPSDF